MNSFQISAPSTAADEFSPPLSPMQAQSPTTILNPLTSPLITNPTPTSPANKQPPKEPCTIYKISLEFLIASNYKVNKKFNQLCENSKRTIQRDISDYSSQFIFNDYDDLLKVNPIYQNIISSNLDSEMSNQKSNLLTETKSVNLEFYNH